MSQPLLFVNDKLVDLDPAFKVAINFQLNEIADIKGRRTVGTNRFYGLLTNNNKFIFEHAEMVQTTSRLHRNRINARLITGGTTYTGFVIVDEVDEKGYSLQFLSGNAELFKAIEGKKISDLDLTSFNREWNRVEMSNVYSSFTSPTFHIVDNGYLSESSRSVDVRKQYYSVYVYTIFEKILTEAGFTFYGSLFSDPRYLRSAIPFTNDKPIHTNEWLLQPLCKVNIKPDLFSVTLGTPLTTESFYMGFDNDSTGGFYDKSNEVTLGPLVVDTVNPPAAYWKTRRAINIEIKSTMVITVYNFNGSLSYLRINVGGDEYIHSAGNGTFTINFLSQLGRAVDGTVTASLSITNCQVQVSGFVQIDPIDVPSDTTIYFGELWEFPINLPDITQADFLKAILQMTGSIIETDGLDLSVRIETYKTMTNEAAKQRAVNIDQFIDHSVKPKNEIHPTGYFQKTWFRYLSDENVRSEYGDYYLSINDNTLPASGTALTLPFAASEFSTAMSDLNMAAVLRVKNGNDIVPKPRILYRANIENVTSNPILLTDGSNTFTKLAFSKFTFNDPFENVSLDWKHLLFDCYSELNAALNDFNKITPRFYFSTNFINQMDLFDPVFSQYFNSYFMINKVENYVDDLPCKAELIKL